VSDDSLHDLLTMAPSDETLMTALRSAASSEEVVGLAQDRGLHISGDDLLADRDLTDAELGMAGGTMMLTAIWCACQNTLPRFC
jgi:predicted ribosomally synthesized peptide with nif11-like leader